MGDYVDDGQTRVRGFEEEERALIEMGGDDWEGQPDPFTACMARLDELNGA